MDLQGVKLKLKESSIKWSEQIWQFPFGLVVVAYQNLHIFKKILKYEHFW